MGCTAAHNRQTDTVTDLRARLGKLLINNQIYDTRGIAAIAIDRRQSVVVIDASDEEAPSLVSGFLTASLFFMTWLLKPYR